MRESEIDERKIKKEREKARNCEKRDKNRKKKERSVKERNRKKKSEKAEKNRKEAKRDEQSEKDRTPREKKRNYFIRCIHSIPIEFYSRNIFQAVVLGRISPIRRMKHRREPGRNLSHGNKNYI